MFTTAEIDSYVNEAAHGYLKEAKPLNETITKIASEHGLNRDQIARVVEGANTEVYVQLMNQTNDKYIQFENASIEKIGEAVFGTEKKAEYSVEDYEEEPTSEISDPNFEKLASVEETTPSETEMVKEAYKLAALDDRLTDSMYEVDVRFQKNSSILHDLIKQAYLGGTSFGDIEKAITTIYDSPVVEKILTESREKLAHELYPKALDTVVKTAGTVNPNNEIIKQAGLLVKDTQEFLTLREKKAEAIESMSKLEGSAAIIVREHLKEAAPLSTTKKVLLGVGLGVAGTAGVHSQMQKVKARDAAMPMSQVSNRYTMK
jgi:hypothetical protein